MSPQSKPPALLYVLRGVAWHCASPSFYPFKIKWTTHTTRRDTRRRPFEWRLLLRIFVVALWRRTSPPMEAKDPRRRGGILYWSAGAPSFYFLRAVPRPENPRSNGGARRDFHRNHRQAGGFKAVFIYPPITTIAHHHHHRHQTSGQHSPRESQYPRPARPPARWREWPHRRGGRGYDDERDGRYLHGW